MRELTVAEVLLVSGGRVDAGDKSSERDCRKLHKLEAKVEKAGDDERKFEKAQDKLDHFMEKHPGLECSTGAA